MLRQFYPDITAESAFVIDYEGYYQKGIRGLIFDIDNTLVTHGADADRRAIALMAGLKKTGYSICLLSNNKKERVERFNRDIGANYIYKAGKPSGKNYRQAMERMKTDLSSTLFIGDQLFTDVFGAKRIGMKHILVKPIDPKEEIQIVFKRYLEKIVLFFYRREEKRKAQGPVPALGKARRGKGRGIK